MLPRQAKIQSLYKQGVQTEQKETQESEEQTLAGATRNISEEAADYSDEAFLNALGKGLMNRWDYNANKNSNSKIRSSKDRSRDVQRSFCLK